MASPDDLPPVAETYVNPERKPWSIVARCGAGAAALTLVFVLGMKTESHFSDVRETPLGCDNVTATDGMDTFREIVEGSTLRIYRDHGGDPATAGEIEKGLQTSTIGDNFDSKAPVGSAITTCVDNEVFVNNPDKSKRVVTIYYDITPSLPMAEWQITPRS